MIVLTPEEMRDLDRRTIEAGTPGKVLMERAARAIVTYASFGFDLKRERIAILCGKGNNGGDGRIAGKMLEAAGARVTYQKIPRRTTLVIDAVLGMGLSGPPRGEALEMIRAINASGATVIAVDVPSGLGTGGEHVIAHHTVTFAALKPVHVLPPWCDFCGEVHVADIGTLPATSKLHLLDRPELAPRRRDSHKGDYGHVLVIGGAEGKHGAAAMCGLAALRAGAGLVTVTAPVSHIVPELMTCGFPPALEGKTMIAIGPGLGMGHVRLVRKLYSEAPVPMVIDADGLNSLVGWKLPTPPAPRILTPHPGEMRRLVGDYEDRVATARRFAEGHGVTLVLKGYRSLIALPEGTVYVNPTGSPAMAKAGSGDILTGMIAGMSDVAAAVWLHGRCGELGEERWTDRCLLATDLLDFLPQAIRLMR